MSNGDAVSISDGGVGVYGRIEARLDRLDDKLDTRMTTQDNKVDAIAQRLDRLEGKLEGSIMMLRWLGPAGVAALLIGLARASGLL